MYDPNDYNGETLETADLEAREAEAEFEARFSQDADFAARMEYYRADYCTFEAAIEGGAEYARQIAESAAFVFAQMAEVALQEAA
jgi:hypothetical protein